MYSMMKKIRKPFLAAALVAASGSAMADDATFNATITLIEPLVVTSVQDLSFAPQTAGSAVDVVTAPGDSTAAIFSATGEPSANAQASILESSIDMTTGAGASAGEVISVDTWTYGGNLAGDGSVSFDGNGDIADMRVGATAHVKAENVSGDYTGTATFRLVYL